MERVTAQGEQGRGADMQRCFSAFLLKQPFWEQRGSFLQSMSSSQPPTTAHNCPHINNCPLPPQPAHPQLPISPFPPPASSHVPSDHLGKMCVSTEAISTPLLPSALVFTDTDSTLWRDPTNSVSVCTHPIFSRTQAAPCARRNRCSRAGT